MYRLLTLQLQAVLRECVARQGLSGAVHHATSQLIDLLGSDDVAQRVLSGARGGARLVGNACRGVLARARLARGRAPIRPPGEPVAEQADRTHLCDMWIHSSHDPTDPFDALGRNAKWISVLMEHAIAHRLTPLVESIGNELHVRQGREVVVDGLCDARVSMRCSWRIEQEKEDLQRVHARVQLTSNQLHPDEVHAWMEGLVQERVERRGRHRPKERTLFSLRADDRGSVHVIECQPMPHRSSAQWSLVPDGLRARLEAAIAEMRRGTACKLGMLLCGPPGIGKTSAMKLVIDAFPEKHVLLMDDFCRIRAVYDFRATFGSFLRVLREGRLVTYDIKVDDMILVFDEADKCGIFRSRATNGTEPGAGAAAEAAEASYDRRTPFTLQHFLEYTDGIIERPGLVIIGSSNKPLEWFDTALTRDGRFGLHIQSDEMAPRKRAREEPDDCKPSIRRCTG